MSPRHSAVRPPPSRRRVSRRSRCGGLTLIELVIVITVSSIVVTFMANFLITPIDAYTAQAQRAQLADTSSALPVA